MRSQTLAIFLACLLPFSTAAAAEESVDPTAHAAAIHMVLSAQAEEVRRLDADSEAQEMAPRTWSVFRPADGGILDRAYTFTVTFAIDGRVVAAWYVNTGEGTVEPLAP